MDARRDEHDAARPAAVDLAETIRNAFEEGCACSHEQCARNDARRDAEAALVALARRVADLETELAIARAGETRP